MSSNTKRLGLGNRSDPLSASPLSLQLSPSPPVRPSFHPTPLPPSLWGELAPLPGTVKTITGVPPTTRDGQITPTVSTTPSTPGSGQST